MRPAGELDAVFGPHRAFDAHDLHARRLGTPIGHDQGGGEIADFQQGEAQSGHEGNDE
jgi:hypothetical protein